jgi:hypothetical protein
VTGQALSREDMMVGEGVLAIWFDIDANAEAELDAWYPRQHLPERLSVPGFLRGRRYAALDAVTRYFTLYEVETVAVLASRAYLERLNNPTDWTRRVLPSFRGMVRGAYGRLEGSAGDRVERHLLAVRISPAPGQAPAVREWLTREGAKALGPEPGVTGWACLAADAGGTGLVTAERKLVGEVLGGPPFVVLQEVADPEAGPGLRERWAGWSRALAAEVTVDLYRLLYGLAWL